VVTLAAADVRRRPDHKSEMRNQLLLGETVKVLEAGKDWWRVRNDVDGYEGWVRTWGLVGCTPARAASWRERARAVMVRLYAEVRTEPGAGARVSPLFWNTRLIGGPVRDGHRPVELPDGRRGWVEAATLDMASRRTPPDLEERVRQLLGVPYLWGGRTPMGFDCSAFVQQLLGEQGVALPRDADQQFRATRRLDAGEPVVLGDLYFFGGRQGPIAHVAMALPGKLFAHSRGRVRINSTDPRNPMYDKRLMDQLRAVHRPRRGRAKRPVGLQKARHST
jgi:cell wall-associated NlpC family hydrolase